MPVKERANDIGRRRARSIIGSLGQEVLEARRQHGLSQERVARAAGISRSQVSRIERGLHGSLTIDLAARVLAIVGLELGARAYPGGPPVRDSAQLALLERFRALLPARFPLMTEVPLPIAGDRRAWDGIVDGAREDDWLAVEAETRPRDLQALLRREALKLRDDPRVTRVLIVLARSEHNQRLVGEYRDLFRAQYPLGPMEVRATLQAGKLPRESGFLLL